MIIELVKGLLYNINNIFINYKFKIYYYNTQLK